MCTWFRVWDLRERGSGERSEGKGSSPLEAPHKAQLERRASEPVVGCVLDDVIDEA